MESALVERGGVVGLVEGLFDWPAGFCLDGVIIEDDFSDALAAEDFFSDVIDVSVGTDDGDCRFFGGFIGGQRELLVSVEGGFRLKRWGEGDVGFYLVIGGVCEGGEEEDFAGGEFGVEGFEEFDLVFDARA